MSRYYRRLSDIFSLALHLWCYITAAMVSDAAKKKKAAKDQKKASKLGTTSAAERKENASPAVSRNEVSMRRC